MMKHRFMVVEGPIGVGKSTLARLLAEALEARLLPDVETRNPYLKAFYRDPAAHALHTQLHFMITRLERLASVRLPGPDEPPLIADFLFDKDPLFAELTLDENEWWMYTRVYQRVAASVPAPDLVIYLQAPLERVIERIERRGLRHERRISSHYLQQLITRYEQFFHSYDDSALLIVNATDINLADRPEDAALLIEHIRRFEGGRQYFNPAVSGS